MIRHIWSVLCRSSSIDRESNALSLFEIAEELSLLEPITQKGVAPFPLQLITLWSRSDPEQPAKAVSRIRLMLPGGQQSGHSAEFQVDLTTFKRVRHRFNMAMFPIAEAGVHEFVVEVRDLGDQWKEVARVPLSLAVKPAAANEKPS